MKCKILLLIIALGTFAIGCDKDEISTVEKVAVAVPILKSLEQIRSEVSVGAARQTDSDGKIYVAENYLFYIAQEEGVHIFDNSNPSSPQNTVFINLAGVHDIAIKGQYLYADNFVDLLVFDVSDIHNIQLVNTIPNTITYSPQYPQDVTYFDYDALWTGSGGEIITGFDIEMREMDQTHMIYEDFIGTAAVNSMGGNPNSVGTGGSYAKFQINKNALYTIDAWQLNVFNIADPQLAFFDKSVYMNQWFGGGVFETLFIQKDFLFVGATNGMFVVDATDEFNPEFISGFSHATACDPVVVFDNTAYITVRGGSTCGAIDDQVNVIDITDISNPVLSSTYLLAQPYGLGIRDQRLYVCTDGGLKVFDAQNPGALELKLSYPGGYTDVIALPTHLIAVAPNKITQFSYGPNYTLITISTTQF